MRGRLQPLDENPPGVGGFDDLRPGQARFDARVDIVEPVGMEVFVFFPLGATEVCARLSPEASPREGSVLRLAADLDKMHIVDTRTGRVV